MTKPALAAAFSVLRASLYELGELLIAAGAVTGLFTAWLYWGQSPLPSAAQRHTNQRIEQAWRSGTAVPGGALALVRIPALGAAWQYPVYEGTGPVELSKGLAHYQGTAKPGMKGNFAIAGHRSSNTGFEPLADLPAIGAGDQIVVDTRLARYVYRVTATEQTVPSDVSVLRPDQGRGADPRARLVTITTCTPRFGSSGRFIVFGILAKASKPIEP